VIALLDNGQDLSQCEAEIGCEVGQLLTPLTRYHLRDASRKWAIDNGGFKRLDIKAFFALLKREEHRREDCLFVSSPDIVGSAMRTLELFDLFEPQLTGWKIAFVCQDGQENLRVPWDKISAIFIGGSTNWKLSKHVEDLIKTAQIFGKWVHIGRVNDPTRFQHFRELGADSCDGTGLARYSHMREAISKPNNQHHLFETSTDG
jgi:hypothetical protein